MVEITSEIKQELHSRLTDAYPEMANMRMEGFSRILGGATTIIFSFDLVSDSCSIPLILRIYDATQVESARREFQTISALHDEGVRVPKPYIINTDSIAMKKPYLVIERIEGDILSYELMALQSGARYDTLLRNYVQEMAALHSMDWSGRFSFLDSRGMLENPEQFPLRELERPREIIIENEVEDLIPVLEWLEENAVRTTGPCLIHGDYHGLNVMVRGDSELVTIDWTSARIGDFRVDLAFAIVTLTSANLDVEDQMVAHYQKMTGRKVEGLGYFKALSSMWNLLRVYSCLFDPAIMGETDETARLFIQEYHDYSRLTVETVQEVTGIGLAQLLDALGPYSTQ